MKNTLNNFVLGAVFVATTALLTVVASPAANAATFEAGRIIDDVVFTNNNSMNAGDIQNFLNSKVPVCETNHAKTTSPNDSGPPYICLKNYSENGRSAAQIIYDTAQTHRINPQTLIVLLQKEQGLVTDTWPWKIQYDKATGYGCPDNAPCDSQYYGLTNQLDWAGRMFRAIMDGSPNWYTPYVLGNNYIQYNPDTSCGGTNVNIQNRATQALYNYTPYQPNPATLAAPQGQTVPCGAYGNLNFWRYFNSWFGSTSNTSFTIAIGDNGSPNQYLLFGGLKQAIPDPETKVAWGIQNIPLTTMSASYLSSLPSGPYLDRLTRLNTSDSTVFFMDGGKRYRVMSQTMFDAWGFGGRPITNVPPALFYFPSDGGELKYSVKDPASSSLYMLDGTSGGQTVLRRYQTDQVFAAWEGEGAPFISVSSNFFNQIDNAVGPALTHTKAISGGSEYQIVNGSRFSQPHPYGNFYPGVAQAISTPTAQRLPNAGQVSHLIRAATANTVYLIDNNTKRAVANPNTLNAWTPPGGGVKIVNSSYVALIPDGSALSTYAATSEGQQYLISNSKYPVPSALAGAYQGLSSTTITSHLSSLYPQSTTTLTGFVRGAASPHVYFLDNSGNKRHIEGGDKATLLGAYTTGITVLSEGVVGSFPSAASPSAFMSDGTNEYLIENGTKHLVSASVKADWGLSSAQVYTDGTLTRFPTGAALTSKIKDGGNYYLIKGGRGFLTTDVNIAGAWGILDAPQMNQVVIRNNMFYYMLTRFVRSTTDNRRFVIDNGQWYNLSDIQFNNLGGIGSPIMGLEPSAAPNTITDWTSVVVKDSVGKHYVIDGATKRGFANSIIQNHWTNNGSLTVPTTTNGFLNLLPNNGTVERAIKGGGPHVYSAENGTKRHILYSSTYHTYYAPYCLVSEALLYALPTGSNI